MFQVEKLLSLHYLESIIKFNKFRTYFYLIIIFYIKLKNFFKILV